MTTGPKDSFLGAWFGIEFGGKIVGAFRECSGLGSENAVVEEKASDRKGKSMVKKIPGNLTWSNIILKQGITDDMTMWTWRKQIEDGQIDEARKDGSIVMFSHEGQELARWNFINAWPTRISGPSIAMNSDDVAVEEIEITHEGYERVR